MMYVLSINAFNTMSDDDLSAKLLTVCFCRRWAANMVALRPFDGLAEIKAALEKLWLKSTEAEQLEAFSGHPRIGDIDQIRKKYTAAAEQGQVLQADESVIQALADYNDRYHQKFGFIFIVCATGLAPEAMLKKLTDRIDNSRNEELANASAEQLKIMHLRLEKLFQGTL